MKGLKLDLLCSLSPPPNVTGILVEYSPSFLLKVPTPVILPSLFATRYLACVVSLVPSSSASRSSDADRLLYIYFPRSLDVGLVRDAQMINYCGISVFTPQS